MNIWNFILEKSKASCGCVLLCVLKSKGSSPGRQGFKMVVSSDGELNGSIGGGIMEHKLVEKAKNMLSKKETQVFCIQQIHRKESITNRSGMICSGEQRIVLIPLQSKKHQNVVKLLSKNNNGILILSPSGIQVENQTLQNVPFQFTFENEKNWIYKENLIAIPTIYIIGAGHVGLALSQQMALLNFKIILIDDREELNTLQQNKFVDQKIICPYDKIGEQVLEGENVYVVIMTFGYRIDKVVYLQLKDKKFAYLGMMGSHAKIEYLMNELRQEKVGKEQIQKLDAPIGIDIFSKTPQEIAVSIAAKIIKIKNKNLPRGWR